MRVSKNISDKLFKLYISKRMHVLQPNFPYDIKSVTLIDWLHWSQKPIRKLLLLTKYCLHYYSISLNIQVDVGEWICFSNMGAYTIAAASRFNGFKQPHVIYMVRQKFVDRLVKSNSEPVLAIKSLQLGHNENEALLLNGACVNW